MTSKNIFAPLDPTASHSLILLTDAADATLFKTPVDELRDEIQNRLPVVQVTATTRLADLDSSLAAAAFAGARNVVVVSLWNQNGVPLGIHHHAGADLGLKINLSEAPPEAEAIISAFFLASLPDEWYTEYASCA